MPTRVENKNARREGPSYYLGQAKPSRRCGHGPYEHQKEECSGQ